jgi:hypothetical protein
LAIGRTVECAISDFDVLLVRPPDKVEVARTLKGRSGSSDWWRNAKSQEDGQALIYSRHFVPRQFAEYAPDPALINGSQMIDERERIFREAAWAGRERRIEKSCATSTCDGHHTYQWKALVADDLRIAHDNAWSNAAPFVADYRVEFQQDD